MIAYDRSFRFTTAFLLLAALTAPSAAAFNPPDPSQEKTSRPFDMTFVSKLRRARSLADVQRLAGSKGKITERSTSGKPHVRYHWVSESDKDGIDFMVLTLYEDGAFGIGLSNQVGPIVINSFGAYTCDKCSPPVNVCGTKPSWLGPDDEWGCY